MTLFGMHVVFRGNSYGITPLEDDQVFNQRALKLSNKVEPSLTILRGLMNFNILAMFGE